MGRCASELRVHIEHTPLRVAARGSSLPMGERQTFTFEPGSEVWVWDSIWLPAVVLDLGLIGTYDRR